MKAAKCAWSFVARQTGALRYTAVGGDVGGGDVGGLVVDGDDVGDGDDDGNMTQLMISMVLRSRATPAKLCDQIGNRREIFLDWPQPEVLSIRGEAQTPI